MYISCNFPGMSKPLGGGRPSQVRDWASLRGSSLQAELNLNLPWFLPSKTDAGVCLCVVVEGIK